MFNLKKCESVKRLFSNLEIPIFYGLYIHKTSLAVRKARDKLPKLGSSNNY